MGAILIHPKDKDAIRKYLKDMDVQISGFISRSGGIVESDDLMKMMNKVSSNLSSNKFPFNIEYIFSYGRAGGYYDKNTNTVVIVVNQFAEWRAEFDSSYRRIYNVSSVDFKDMSVTFLHEFVHFIQNELRMAKSGNYTLPSNWSEEGKYYKRGWERQAHAIGYLEKLKQDLNIRKPEVILRQLKKMGALHNDDLNKLKQTDYKSWKAIMKQAIMATLADIEDRKAIAA